MKNSFYKYDLIVIGGGLAGCAAACAASAEGSSTLLISINMDSVAIMQFGNMFKPTSQKGVSFNMRGKEKFIFPVMEKNILVEVGMPAEGFEELEGYRVIDRKRFALQVKELLERQDNLNTRQGLAVEIRDHENGYIVKTSDLIDIKARSIIICTGTFMNGKLSWGGNSIQAGRPGEIYSSRLYSSLVNRGIKFQTKKLLSAPKVLSETIEKGAGNIRIYKGSRANIYSVSLNNGRNRDRSNARLHLLPEGTETGEMYVYGFETDLSEDEQLYSLRQIEGLEKIYMTRPGYKIEYSCLVPSGIRKETEPVSFERLFFAGRVTGIASYGLSLIQGFKAGKNASRIIKGEK